MDTRLQALYLEATTNPHLWPRFTGLWVRAGRPDAYLPEGLGPLSHPTKLGDTPCPVPNCDGTLDWSDWPTCGMCRTYLPSALRYTRDVQLDVPYTARCATSAADDVVFSLFSLEQAWAQVACAEYNRQNGTTGAYPPAS